MNIVAPYMGAWIEIYTQLADEFVRNSVAPYMGAWIEINWHLLQCILNASVAPYMGAWIEIVYKCWYWHDCRRSHPTWVRGLKLTHRCAAADCWRVAPYMGAWIEMIDGDKKTQDENVAPYMGAWIEI